MSKIMTSVALLGLVSLLLSFTSPAHSYDRGNMSCRGFEDVEQNYREEPDDIINQLAYGECLITKGEDDKGLALLYQLAREPVSLVAANYHLAQYFATGGTFSRVSYDDLNKALNYYLHALAIIKATPNYPDFFRDDTWERSRNIELNSYLRVPDSYLRKYDVGSIGDYHVHLLNSPSYKGDTNLKTYPQYNTTMLEDLNEVVEHAQSCMNLCNCSGHN